MNTRIQVDHNKGFIQLVLSGSAHCAAIKSNWLDSQALFCHTPRLLMDCRKLDLSIIRFLDWDTVSSEVKTALAGCLRLAVVCPPGRDHSKLMHLVNMCLIHNIVAEIFSDTESASTWLVGEP